MWRSEGTPSSSTAPSVGGESLERRESSLSEVLGGAFQKALESTLLKEIRSEPIPLHVAIIMDGNRRFAQEMGLPVLEGHIRGRDTLENVLEWCLEVGIRYLTVYAFSTENFQRSPEEVAALMALFEENFLRMAEDERVHRHRIHVRAIGQIERLPEGLQKAIARAEERTRDYSDYFYTIAIAYGGRQEIVRAVREIASDVKEGRVDVEEIDEEMITERLWTSHLPDPDLILRTSGEERISNFLLWQVAYSELYFTDVYWPGFRKVDFLKAIRTFQQRKRRFGK